MQFQIKLLENHYTIFRILNAFIALKQNNLPVPKLIKNLVIQFNSKQLLSFFRLLLAAKAQRTIVKIAPILSFIYQD